MKEPEWLTAGRRYIGQTEVPGKGSNPWITSLWAGLGGAWVYATGGNDDSAVPWCGAFVAECMKEAGIGIPANWYRARAWLDWGVPLMVPIVGAIVVFTRIGGGHVGIVAGRAKDGRLMVLGGNQSDRVSIQPFEAARISGFRWPIAMPSTAEQLPVLAANGQPSSHNEA